MQIISWHLKNNINDLRNLFSQITLPYYIDTYICYCGHMESIINDETYDLDKYICPSCQNEEFYEANKYRNNSLWYEPIYNLLNEDYIFSLNPVVKYDNENKILKAIVQMNIPNSIDLASNNIVYEQKNLFELQINNEGELKEILDINFDLKSQLSQNERKYLDYVSDEELISRNPLLIAFKKKILNAFIKNSNHFKSRILHKTKSLEEFSFFVNNPHLLDTQFYKWGNIELIPKEKELTIIEALDYVLNYRTEKTLKKTVFENYKMQLKNYNCYNLIYTYSLTKCIRDVNILNRMINIDLKSHIERINIPYDLYDYIEFLSTKFTDKQIENLFLSYEKKEKFWLVDTVSIFSEITAYIHEFEFRKCNVENLHDDIIRFHKLVLNKHLMDVKFEYEDKFLNACRNIENYQIKLPLDGIELYDWSSKLQNCLSGYWNLIKNRKTIVYGFLIDNEIKFAVEIKNNKITQSKSKYNKDLQNKEMSLVKSWFKENFEEKDNKNITQN